MAERSRIPYGVPGIPRFLNRQVAKCAKTHEETIRISSSAAVGPSLRPRPDPEGVPVACVRKGLPSAPGFGYNVHVCRPAVQFNPTCPADLLARSRTSAACGPPDKDFDWGADEQEICHEQGNDNGGN